MITYLANDGVLLNHLTMKFSFMSKEEYAQKANELARLSSVIINAKREAHEAERQLSLLVKRI